MDGDLVTETVGRRRQTAGQTRQQILAVAADLFLSGGYAATSLASVADALHVSPATIHKYFRSKQALAEQVCALHLGSLLDHIHLASLDAEPFAVRLPAVARALATYHWANPAAGRWSTYLYVSAYRSEWTVFEHFREDVTAFLRDLLAGGVARGELADSAVDDALSFYDALRISMHPLALCDVSVDDAAARAQRVAHVLHRAVARP